MSVPSGSENRFLRNQTNQFNSEVRTEEHSKITESDKSGKIGNDLRQYDFHGVEVTKPILSVSYLCENGTETHLARENFLRYGDRREPLIKKNGVYFVKAQIVHEVKVTTESCVRAGESPKSCVRTQNSCVQVEGLQKLKISHVCDAIIQPAVEDPVHDDRIPVEAGAELIPIPCEPSEPEKMKHELTHIPFKPWRTSRVKRKSTI